MELRLANIHAHMHINRPPEAYRLSPRLAQAPRGRRGGPCSMLNALGVGCSLSHLLAFESPQLLTRFLPMAQCEKISAKIEDVDNFKPILDQVIVRRPQPLSLMRIFGKLCGKLWEPPSSCSACHRPIKLVANSLSIHNRTLNTVECALITMVSMSL